ncbi:hypothetical protein [Candidatus Carsonella ruddii]|uniref:hypothetical protein n=1 Tax=Carsonella ruddii TaxID=114186 RepID=UPI003D8140C3
MNTFQGSNPCLSRKIFISILSIKKTNFKNKIIEILNSNFYYYHIDIMNFNYVNNTSFCFEETKIIFKYLKKFLNIKIELHLMTKVFKFKINFKNIIHLENNFISKNISIGYNFCWNYLFFLKKNFLIMSVIPGFGNQKFLKKTQKIFFRKSNIDGGISKKIFKIIRNYFNKIIIGSKIINLINIKTFYIYNFSKNNFLI